MTAISPTLLFPTIFITCVLIGLISPSASATEQVEPEVVVIEGRPLGENTEISNDAKVMTEIPGTIGDPLGAIFSLPGVVYSGGDSGKPAVRGSSPQDNGFWVDFLPAGYVFHEFSTSVFHQSILYDFQMYPSGYGPEYSQVTGAVFDIRLRDPKNQEFSGTADISMLRSGILIESGLTDNSAFYAAYRKSLVHLFIPDNEEKDGVTVTNVPQDDDYQLKYLWHVDADNQLTVSTNGASDTAGAAFSRESEYVRSNPDFAGDASLDTNFNSQSVIWDHYGGSGKSLKVGFGHLDDNSRLNWGSDYFSRTTFQQNTLKAQLSLPLTKKHFLTVGSAVKDYTFTYTYDLIQFVCTEFDPDCDLGRRGRIRDKDSLHAREYLLYINDSWMLTDRLEWNLGAQWQSNDYTNEDFTNPRTSLRFHLNSAWTVTTKLGRYNRFPDLDFVLPEVGNPDLKSPVSDHFSIGVENNLEDGWRWSLETYYKTFDNLPLALQEDEPDADELYSNDIEGKAYGLELFVNKELTDDWYSWLAISYAKSERTNKRNGETRDYYLDTPLVFNWVLNYQWTNKFNLSWRWTVRSGAAYTPIVGLQENPFFEDSVLPVYGEPYSKRLPTYTRLDIRFEWDLPFRDNQGELVLDILNATNRRNVTDRGLDYDRIDSVDDSVKTEDTEGLGIIPALGYRMHF